MIVTITVLNVGINLLRTVKNSVKTGRNLNDVEDEWNKRSDNDKL